jgi:hypothetical protein
MVKFAYEFERPLTSTAGNYVARLYGQQQTDGRWGGWLVFVATGGRMIATDRETTQSTLAELTYWATGLSDVYLQGALERALALQPAAQLTKELQQLERIEAEAKAEAASLESAAATARATLEAAEAARRRTEEQLLATIADTAEARAVAHDEAAAMSRSTARVAKQALKPRKPRRRAVKQT